MTLAIPEELHQLMRKHDHIKWSEIARRAMCEEAKKLEFMDKLLSKSKLSEQDAMNIGRKINKGIANKHKSE